MPGTDHAPPQVNVRRIIVAIIVTYSVAIAGALLLTGAQDDPNSVNERFSECSDSARAAGREAAHCSVFWPD